LPSKDVGMVITNTDTTTTQLGRNLKKRPYVSSLQNFGHDVLHGEPPFKMLKKEGGETSLGSVSDAEQD
jgi:hypothetical protein